MVFCEKSRRVDTLKLPETIKIGPVDYVIRENDRYSRDNLVGQILYYESIIEMQPNMAPGMVEVGLWHEMLHGVLIQGGFREHDERLLDVLAHGIVRLLQDNPVLRETNGQKTQPGA